MPAHNRYLWILLALAVAACSKSDPPPAPKAQSAAKPAAASTPAAAAKTDIDDGLKERLARQEAAAKMFEAKVLNPPAPKAPEPPAAAKPAPERASAEPPVRAAPPESPAPQQVAAAPAQAPAPVKAEPKATPVPATPSRNDVAAAARPTPAPAVEAPTTRLVSRVDPDFPREAASAGVGEGNVKARMTLDAAGGVTRVEILEATPRRVFDRAVMRALSQWRYNEGTAGRTVDMEIAFRSR